MDAWVKSKLDLFVSFIGQTAQQRVEWLRACEGKGIRCIAIDPLKGIVTLETHQDPGCPPNHELVLLVLNGLAEFDAKIITVRPRSSTHKVMEMCRGWNRVSLRFTE